MVSARTEITEIVTGLAMLGYRDVERALKTRPRHVHNVTDDHFDRLDKAHESGTYGTEFETAWANGVRFANSVEGLRGRPPWLVQWKGPHKPPGYEQIPADLRVDHVYLISCKYGSSILHNASPSHLFDRSLAHKLVERDADWFHQVAPESYQDLYQAFVSELGLASEMPNTVAQLERSHRNVLRKAAPGRRWPGEAAEVYRFFTVAVAQESAVRWLASLGNARQREEMVWRLLRLQAAPYFVLGATLSGEPTRYRVDTPWDFRDEFKLKNFDVWADPAGQPIVRWRADVAARDESGTSVVDGHVEVRWSHGRFSGSPEVKVHLDTHPHQVPGYVQLS